MKDGRGARMLDLGVPSGTPGSRASRAVPHVSPLKKVLMTLMILGAMGTTVGAGTFASFNAATSSTGENFATGSIVLSDTNNRTATTCLSTGAATSTDVNDYTGCDPLFLNGVVDEYDINTADNAYSRRPGELATVDFALTNSGTLAGVLKAVPGACTATADVTAVYNGTNTALCSNLQVSLQEYTTAARTTPSTCLFGPGKNSALVSSALTFPKTIASGTSKMKFVVNGVSSADVGVVATTYTSIDGLAKAWTTALAAASITNVKINYLNAYNGVVGDKRLVVVPTTAVSIGTANAGAQNGITNYGFTNGASNSGNGTTCLLGTTVMDDPRETLSTIFSSYGTTGLTLGNLNISATRYYRMSVMLPVDADPQLQGRIAQFALKWTLTQS